MPPSRTAWAAQWIAQRAARRHPHAPLVVEVGVGHDHALAAALRSALARTSPRTRLACIDKDARALADLPAGVRGVQDDVLAPDLRQYRGAVLLVAQHPPPELVPGIEALADRIGAEAVVLPLSQDAGLFLRWAWTPVADGGRIQAWLRLPAASRHLPSLSMPTAGESAEAAA